MGVVLKTLGKRALIIYLSVIGIFSLIFGYMLDLFFPTLLEGQLMEHSEDFGLLEQASAIIMLTLMAYFLLLPIFKKQKGCEIE